MYEYIHIYIYSYLYICGNAIFTCRNTSFAYWKSCNGDIQTQSTSTPWNGHGILWSHCIYILLQLILYIAIYLSRLVKISHDDAKRPKNRGDPNCLKSAGCVLTLRFVVCGERNPTEKNGANKGWEFRLGFKGERVFGCYFVLLWRRHAGILVGQATAKDLQVEFIQNSHTPGMQHETVSSI